MHSPALALAWQTCRRHRLGLAIVVGLVFAVSVLFQLLSETVDRKHGYLCTFQFVFALIYVAAVFAYGFESALESGESGFPRRQFTLPMRTADLVFWPMFLGTAFVALVWTAWAYFVLRPAGIELALGPAALQAAAITAVLQALMWWPFGIPWVRVIIAVAIVPLLILAPILAVIIDLPETSLTVFFFVLLAGAYVMALAGVARTRRGDTPTWQRPFASTAVLVRRSTRRAHPFSSYARALCWFEDRRHLLSFPLVVGCAAILHLLLIFWLEDVQENKFRLGINFLGIPPLLAPILGIRLGRSGSSPKTAYLLSSFTATRPVGTTSLVAAKLKTAALSTLWACGVLVLLASVWFFGTGLHRQMPDWWRGMYAENRHWKVAATALLVGAVLFLITWRLLVDGICAALTGRSWIAHGNLLLHGVALTAGVMIGADALSRYADYQRVRDALPWCAGAAVFIRLLLAVWLVRILVQRQLVEGRTLVGLTILWAATAAALFGLAWHVIPEGLVSPWLLFCGVMLALPLVRLSATPLALAWNRHR